MSEFKLTSNEKQRRKEISEYTRNMIISELNIEDQDETSVMAGYRGYYLQISFSKLHPLMVVSNLRNRKRYNLHCTTIRIFCRWR